MRTFVHVPVVRSHTRSVVSLEPDIAVLASDILRQRTVDVWPRKVCTLVLRKRISIEYDLSYAPHTQ